MGSETKNPATERKRFFLIPLVVLVLFLLVVPLVAFVVPPMALRYVFSRVETETGIAITFGKAYIYLEEGTYLYIEDIAIKRQNHHSSNVDLKMESVRMPAMFPADFYSPVLYMRGLRGTVERVASGPTKENEHQEEVVPNQFDVKALLLHDAQIDFTDRTLPKPFQATFQVEYFFAHDVGRPSIYERPLVFEPYVLLTKGQIATAKFRTMQAEMSPSPPPYIEFTEVPLGLFAPYAPVLDDIFVKGSMNIAIYDQTDATRKRVHVSTLLQPDCKIKSANEILAPAIQMVLRQLDQSSLSELQDLKGKIERLKAPAESVRGKLDEIAPIIERLSFLAPREVREEYEKFKSQYDRAMAGYVEWNMKFETLLRELDQVKIRIIESTFQAFIDSGTPIEIELQEVDGEWQYDAYEVVSGLIERNYRTIITAEYQIRVQEIRTAVDRLLTP